MSNTFNIALVRNGIVENIAVWDGVTEWNPENYEKVIIEEGVLCGIGFKYENNLFINPNEEAEISSNSEGE